VSGIPTCVKGNCWHFLRNSPDCHKSIVYGRNWKCLPAARGVDGVTTSRPVQRTVSLPARHQMQLTKTVAAKPQCVGKDGSFVVYLYSDSAAQAAGRVTNRPRAHKFVNTDRETWVCLRTLSRLRVPTTESAPRRMTFKNVDCEPGLFFIDRDVMVGRSRCAVGTPRRGATTVSWFVLGYLQRIEGLNWPFS